MAPLMPAYYRPEQLTPSIQVLTGNWLRRYLRRLASDNVPDHVRGGVA